MWTQLIYLTLFTLTVEATQAKGSKYKTRRHRPKHDEESSSSSFRAYNQRAYNQ